MSDFDFPQLLDDTGATLSEASRIFANVVGLIRSAFDQGLGSVGVVDNAAIGFYEAGTPRLAIRVRLPDGQYVVIDHAFPSLSRDTLGEMFERGQACATSIACGLLKPSPAERVSPINRKTRARRVKREDKNGIAR